MLETEQTEEDLPLSLTLTQLLVEDFTVIPVRLEHFLNVRGHRLVRVSYRIEII